MMRPRSVWAVLLAGVGALLLAMGLVVTFGSVESDAPAEQGCTGSAALQWTRTDLEPCRSDAIDQFIGGVIFVVVAAALLVAAVAIERVKRRRRSAPPVGSPAAGMAAVDNAATRVSLRRVALRATAQISLGILLLSALGVLASWRGGEIERFESGASETVGTVVWADLSLIEEFLSDAVAVEYTVDGERYRATVYLNDSSPEYRGGSSVTVLYAAGDPSHATIEGEDNDPPTFVWPFIGLLIGGFALLCNGAVHAVRWRRWQSSTRRYAWTPSEIRTFIAEGRHPLHLMRIDGGEPLRLRLIRERHLVEAMPDDSGRARVWLAGYPADSVVVALPGGRVIGGATPLRRKRERRRWQAAVEAAEAELAAFDDDVLPPS